MWKFYTSVVLLLLCISDGDSAGASNGLGASFFFPGFPFPPQINFPGGLWDLPNRILRPPSRPRPRPQAPDDREHCPPEGIKLISHPRNCEKFILCADGEELSVLNCPDGLHFSRVTRTCTDPRAAGCEDFDWECPDEFDPGNIVFIPDTSDCNRYYLCWAGSQIPMSCAPGLHWSIFENACLPPGEAMCTFRFMANEEISPAAQIAPIAEITPTAEVTPAAGEIPVVQASILVDRGVRFNNLCPRTGIESIPNPSSCEDFYLCINGVQFERQCNPGLHFSPTIRQCVNPDIAECFITECPPTGLAFLPHEDDCNKYYICFMGMRTLMRCPQDLHWSTDQNRCMDPEEAGCDDIYECPATGVIQIPYPDDCERFVLCINGVGLPLNCAPGLHFSPTARTCMDPAEAGCEDYLFQCPEEDTPGVIVFLPNTEDCTMYYLCWQGNQIPLRCGAGLHWSMSQNRCLPPDIAECPWDDDEDSCPDEGITAIPHPDSCSHYILCVNGHEVERDCAPGLHFSRELRNCVHPLLAGCIFPANGTNPIGGITRPADITIPGGVTRPINVTRPANFSTIDDSCPTSKSTNDVVFLPNRNDCGSYYLCYKNERKLFDCSKGLHFDMNLRRCMRKDKAQCVIQQ